MDRLQKFKSITKRKQSCKKPQVILPKPETKYELVAALKYHKRNVDNLCLLKNTEVPTELAVNSPHHPGTL